ncbi:MAG: hypothetical protein JXA92_04035 [candidate division Zixibacteria bacterium]|nr:hypothetical protein [candidate division Zixibacteria bacterium]
MNMPKITIVYAALLILLGLVGFFGFGRSSITALIPAFFGVLVLVAGLLALDKKLRRLAMHAASALSLLGFLGTVTGLIKLFTLISGGEVARPAAVVSQAIMAILSLIFFILCLKSFIDARRTLESAPSV